LTATPAAALDAALAEAFGNNPPAALGVAISGGGDSVALMVLLADWAAARGVALLAATVNHNLRPGAADEARAAARLCTALGATHATLAWQGWDGRGNLQDAARRARQRLLADWAQGRAISHVALGHTLDDQAETVLLRLARGSGVDGLSGMALQRNACGVTWLRPLLAVPREVLRDVLRARGLPWAEDPSNDDPRFDRVKARAALRLLAQLGVGAQGLADTAARMAQARAALAQAAAALFDRVVQIDRAGCVQIDAAIWDAPDDLRERVMAQVLVWIGRAEYRPRHAALRGLLSALRAGGGGTLMGCDARAGRDGSLRIGRELRAVAALRAAPGALWDGRWRLHPPPGSDTAGLEIGVLGPAGLVQCPDWRATGLSRRALLPTPAVWRGDELIAAPLVRDDHGWRAELTELRDVLRRKVLLH